MTVRLTPGGGLGDFLRGGRSTERGAGGDAVDDPRVTAFPVGHHVRQGEAGRWG